MMKYIARLDIYVLIDLGIAMDGINYFDLGPNGLKFLNKGGFKTYLKKIKRKAFKENVLKWLPITISIFALIATVWTKLQNDDKKVKAIQKQIDSLSIRQSLIQNQISQIDKKMDSLIINLKKPVQTTKNHLPRHRTKSKDPGNIIFNIGL